MKDKKQIRAEIKAVLAAMDPAEAARASSAAAARLIAEREFTDARSVMIFLPIYPGRLTPSISPVRRGRRASGWLYRKSARPG